MKTQTRIGLAMALTLALLAGLAPRAGAADYKLQLAFTNYTRAEVLTNFPVLVTFSNGLYGTFDYETFTAPASGGDLRFMDSTESTYLDFEIEKWESSGASYVWVRVPQLSSNTVIYAKWGGSDTTLPACTTNGAVWTNGFASVWHLGQTNGVLDLKDWTAYRRDGANSGTVSAAGRIGQGVDFESAESDYINVPTGLASSYIPSANSPITVSCWFNPESIGSGSDFLNRMINLHDTTGPSSGFVLGLGQGNKLQGLVDGNLVSGPTSYNLNSSTSLSSGQWYQGALVYDGNVGILYLNGKEESRTATGAKLNPGVAYAAKLGAFDGTQLYYDGLLDEARIASVARSSNWVWACYANTASNAFFNGYGTVQASADALARPQIQNRAPSGVLTHGATFNGYLVTNGTSTATVYVAWGQTNASVSGAWAATNWWNSGDWTNGSSPATNMTLEANANYYYTFGATNSTTNVTASGYQYLITGEVTVQPTDPTGRVTLADTAAFTVYRPASCTNDALTVAYTLGGTATNGTHYTNAPAASGTNGTVTIPAGQTNAVITVYPLNLVPPLQTVVLSLVSSNYAIGAANAATCTLAGAVSPYKLQLAFTNYTAAEVLTNFPVLVTFSNGLYGTFAYNTFTSPTNGGDLRFMDSSETTYLDFEIEKWATNDASYVWVRVPLLSSNTTIYAKWGGSDTTLPACTTNGAVWTNGYAAVWHLGETVSGARADSTANTNRATPLAYFGTEPVSGIAGGAYYCQATDTLSAPDSTSLRPSRLTIEAWCKPDMTFTTMGSYPMLVDKQNWASQKGYLLGNTVSPGNTMCSRVLTGTTYQDTTYTETATGQWVHIVGTYDGSTGRIYRNGSQQSSSSFSVTIGYDAQVLNIGGNFKGAMDEVRVSSVARSANWIWACYANVASNAFFNGYGTVIAPATATAPPQIQNLAPTGVGTNGATFNGYLVTNGFENAAVYVAWGQTNGVWTTNWWAAGAWTNGSYPSTNLTLSANANYYYTFGATNSTTNVTASGYQYLITGEVTVQPTDPTGRVTLADTAAFTVSRPASCTNETLTVAYTLGGTATNLTHYTNSPAVSVTNGTVTILAGQTNAVITVYPLNLAAPEQTVVMSLVSSNYALGAANSATCTLAAIGTQYYTSQTGDWTNSAIWGGSGPPSSGDQGLVRHGSAYDNTVLATTNLGAAGNYATITVATNGWLSAKAAASSTGTIIANPVIFDGGKIGSGHWSALGGEWTGPITITTNGLISATGRDGSPKLSGKVSGPGGITLTTPDVLGSGGLTLNNASNDFLGSVVVTQGTLTLACDHALPTGKVVDVYSAGAMLFNVSQTYASEPPPIINLYGGTLQMGTVGGANNLTNALVINVSAADGYFNSGSGWNTLGRQVTGPITIASGGTLNVGESCVDGWNLNGLISGAGGLRFHYLNSFSPAVGSVIAGTNNTHSGGTLVATYGATTHTVTARGEGSLGTGPVTVETNTIMALDKTSSADWTLTNTLAGAGTFKVEDGSTSYRLTAGGTVSPGANSGHTAILRVDGKFAFGLNGATPATLVIDVASVGATPGVHHDQLLVDHPDDTLAASITNCALVVTRVPTPVQMNGLTLTIVSAAGVNFSSYTFASVSELGEGGAVVYGDDSITLTWTAQTPVINNGAFSNLAATSCDVSGTLSSTGASPTVVRCYYGTNSPGESGWGYTNDLGTQAVGTIWTALTGLTSNVKYYYRFYATNDVGDYWSVATSNFTTLGDIYWNDAVSGNWKADNADTWGAGANVYPQNVLNDHVTVDSHLVRVTNAPTIVAADVTLTTSGSATGRLSFVNALAHNQSFILDGGRLGIFSDGNSPGNVVLNGNLKVKSASILDPGTYWSPLNTHTSTLNGNIEDYGPGTTGVLRVDGSLYAGGLDAAGRVAYNGVSTNFSGGWLIQSTANGALESNYAWFGVYQDGGLGASTVTVTRGQLKIDAMQSSTAQRPAPGRVIVNAEGRLRISSGVNVTNWTVELNGGQMWWYGASKYDGGTLAMNSNSTWGGATAGNKEYAGTISGAGRLDMNPTGGSGPFILSGNNSGFSGGIRLLADSVTASHTNGLGTGPVLLASQSGGKLTLDRLSGNFDWTLANNLSGGCTNGSTAVAIQVEDGVGTNTLTVLGTVDPGTNTVAGATNIMGILRVDGDMAFGVGSRLRIHIADTNGVAGVDFDRLLVDHDLTGLGSATLEVNINTNLAQTSLQGQELVVVSNAAALVGTFSTVQWNAPWIGTVRYNDPTGTVKLLNICVAQGSVFRFR